MRICIDVDGTICETKKADEEYCDVKIKEGAAETIRKWKAEGHYIIISTARNMGKYDGNIGKIIANQAPVLQEWLKRHDIPYDELHFGKILADVYLDDKALTFQNWNETEKVIEIISSTH
jgi:capsule biosynthesis phosphatase